MPERRDRLPLLAPEQLETGQRDLYEAIIGGPRADGPFAMTDDQGRLLAGVLAAADIGAPTGENGECL